MPSENLPQVPDPDDDPLIPTVKADKCGGWIGVNVRPWQPRGGFTMRRPSPPRTRYSESREVREAATAFLERRPSPESLLP